MAVVNVPCYNADGSRAEDIPVDSELFGERVFGRTLHQMVVGYHKNQRVGTVCAKTRGEIAFSNKKPYRQKGTGRARAGTRRSPLWRKGGVIHPPRPRDFRARMPKQMRMKALDSALLDRLQTGRLVVVQGLDLDEPKTSAVYTVLEAIEDLKPKKQSCLFGLGQPDDVLYRSARNIARLKIQEVRNFNADMVLRHAWLVLTKEGLQTLLDEREADEADADGSAEASDSASN